jgi:hypothetical protein
LVDNYPLHSINRELLDPEPEKEQELKHPEIDVVWNYFKKGDGKTFAVNITVTLPRLHDL